VGVLPPCTYLPPVRLVDPLLVITSFLFLPWLCQGHSCLLVLDFLQFRCLEKVNLWS
jgi:hypothetical protein